MAFNVTVVEYLSDPVSDAATERFRNVSLSETNVLHYTLTLWFTVSVPADDYLCLLITTVFVTDDAVCMEDVCSTCLGSK